MSDKLTAPPPSNSHSSLSNDPPDLINIPKHSFTAFRLSYATSAEVSHFATSVFIGKVPDAWILLSDKDPLFSPSPQKQSKTGFWISRAVMGFRKRFASDPGIGKVANRVCEPTPSNQSNTAQTQTTVSSTWESLLVKPFYDSKSGNRGTGDFAFSGLNDNGTKSSPDHASSSSRPGIKHGADRLMASHGTINSESSLKQNSRSGHQVEEFGQDSRKPRIVLRLKSENSPQSNNKSFDPSSSKPKSMLLETKESPLNYSIPQKYTTSVSPGPKILSRKGKSRISLPNDTSGHKTEAKYHRVQFATLIPEKQLNTNNSEDEYTKAEKEYHRTIRKLRSAFKSKEISRSPKRSKLHFVGDDLRKRRPGEIIRVDKMLVMIKKINNVSYLTLVNERSDFSSVIQDHWKEYHVVLKVNEQYPAGLVIQLFDAKKKRDVRSSPEHSIVLDKKVRADFFSHTDKTLSITHLVNDGIKVYIMNTKYYSMAYKWLGMMKELLHEDIFPTLAINVAGTKTQIKVTVPLRLIGSTDASLCYTTLHQQRLGYEVQRDNLFKFMVSKVKSYTPDVSGSNWMAFCLRHYDRIEWLPVDGETILAQSQFLQDDGILEYRQVIKNRLLLEIDVETRITRPFPIEGFLSRITSSLGREVLRLQTFHKIQYFFSCDNILFFSSFFQALPPSPNNANSKRTVEGRSNYSLVPEFYHKNPYTLDQNEHIPWLLGADFDRYDREAAEEFSRKVQLIVGAKAMVDTSTISTVRPIPLDQLKSRHLYFQLYLWHSSSTILQDTKCLDVGFEICLFGGSSLRLLAPLTSARDEWVSRLNSLALYWKLSGAKSQYSMASGKLEDTANHGLKDYVTSNLSFGSTSLDRTDSAAIPSCPTLSSLAMQTQVLRSGYLYLKQKKHSNFNKYFVVLCPGHLVIFSVFKRSKISGVCKQTPYYERYMTIPLSECYVYSGSLSLLDLVDPQGFKSTDDSALPRLYPDGWKSSEEEYMRCFSVWFGGKRALRSGAVSLGQNSAQADKPPKNPGIVHMTRKLGVTGKIIVFLARSRQEREHWVYNILQEINRLS